MNIIKNSFRIHRKDPLIYNSYGISHLDDVGDLYLHDKNISYDGKTAISQPIGEAMTFMANGLKERYLSVKRCDGDVYITAKVPNEWKINRILPPDLDSFHIMNMNHAIYVEAKNNMNENCNFLVADDKMKNYSDSFFGICALIATELIENIGFNIQMARYIQSMDMLSYVMLCEDFYQKTKFSDSSLQYLSINPFKKVAWSEIKLEDDDIQLPKALVPIKKAIPNLNHAGILFVGPLGDIKKGIQNLLVKNHLFISAKTLNNIKTDPSWIENITEDMILLENVQLLDFNGISLLNDLLNTSKSIIGIANTNYGDAVNLADEIYYSFAYIHDSPIYDIYEMKAYLHEKYPNKQELIHRILKVYNRIKGTYDLRDQFTLPLESLEKWIQLEEILGYKSAFEKVVLPLAKRDTYTEIMILKILDRY